MTMTLDNFTEFVCIKFDCLFNFNYFISDADEDLKRRVETYVHNKCVIMFNTVFLLLSTYIIGLSLPKLYNFHLFNEKVNNITSNFSKLFFYL